MEQIAKEELASKILDSLRLQAKKLCVYSLFIPLSGLGLCLLPDGVKIEIVLMIVSAILLTLGLIDAAINTKRVKQGKYRTENVKCERKWKEEIQNPDSDEDYIYYISFRCINDQKINAVKVNEYSYLQLNEGQEYVLVYLGRHSRKPRFFLSPD